MNLSTQDYHKFRLYVIKHATLHGFKVQDCDDIFHDALLHIVEHDTPAIDYYKIMWKYIGNIERERDKLTMMITKSEPEADHIPLTDRPLPYYPDWDEAVEAYPAEEEEEDDE